MEVHCSFPRPRSTSRTFQGMEETTQCSSSSCHDAACYFFCWPSRAGAIKSHFSCLAVQSKPSWLRNPLQRGSDLTYPFHPETHSESPSKQSWSSSWHWAALCVPTLARLLTHPPGSSTGTCPEALERGHPLGCFALALAKKAGGGWVMGEKAQIPPGPPPHHSDRLYSTWMETATKCWLATLETHLGSWWHCEFASQSSPPCVTLQTCTGTAPRSRQLAAGGCELSSARSSFAGGGAAAQRSEPRDPQPGDRQGWLLGVPAIWGALPTLPRAPGHPGVRAGPRRCVRAAVPGWAVFVNALETSQYSPELHLLHA